jgi:hypothetical protein
MECDQVVEMVVSYLNFFDVLAAKRVCKHWKVIVERLRKPVVFTSINKSYRDLSVWNAPLRGYFEWDDKCYRFTRDRKPTGDDSLLFQVEEGELPAKGWFTQYLEMCVSQFDVSQLGLNHANVRFQRICTSPRRSYSMWRMQYIMCRNWRHVGTSTFGDAREHCDLLKIFL